MQARAAIAEGLARWAAAERGRFAIWLPLCMAAGVVLYDSFRAEPPGWAGAGLGLLALLAARHAPIAPARAGGAALAACALGFGAAQLATWRAAPLVELPRQATIVAGTVRAVEQLPRGRRVTIAAPSLDGAAPLPRMIRLRLRAGDEVPLATGDGIRVRALVQPPSSPAWPGGWDLQRDAFYDGMGGYGFALNPAERMAGRAPGGLPARLQSLREAIAGRIGAVLPGAEGALAATLLTGATSSIPEADRAAFRDSGLAHLLAIAGLHIGIVMGWVFFTTRLVLALSEQAALRWPLKAIAALAALAAGGFYMLLSGAHVPIMRSFAMACLVTLAVLAGRRALSLRGLALAMAAVILVSPNAVGGVSFQMSFSAVLALIAGYEALRPWLSRIRGDGSWRRRLLGHVVALALTSALAGTASAPYGAYHFGHVQLYYVFANMVAVPLTALWVMPAGMLALLLMPLHGEWLPLAAMGWGIDAVLAVGRHVAAWPAAVLAVPPMPPWGLVAVSFGLAWLGIWRTRVRLAGLAPLAAGLLSPLALAPPDVMMSADGRLLAVRTEGAILLQSEGAPSRFVLDSWLQRLPAVPVARLPVNGIAPGAVCDRGACEMRAGARRVLVLRTAERCDGDLLVSLEPIRHACPARPPRFDRFSVWREGAHAIRFTPEGVRVVTDRGYRGERPWVVPLPTRTSVPPGLVVAPAEALPEE
jgi:competence protein ComEC